MTATKRLLRIDFTSDSNCPFCLIGKKRLEVALKTFPDVDFQITYHPFELAPNLSKEGESKLQMYANKFGQERVDAMIPSMKAAGLPLGINFNYSPEAKVSSTFDALRLITKAQQFGIHNQVKEAIMRAYHEECKTIGNDDVLADCFEKAGGDRSIAIQFLKSDELKNETREEIKLAQQSGINGVPHIIFGGKYAVSGAQDPSHFEDVIRRALSQ